MSFADMTALGRNPGRIIPAIRRFTDSRRPRRTRFVGEPVWAGRSAAETAEATRHEALINSALAAVPTTILCPYDANGLGAAVLEDARRTHPRVVEGGARRPSPDYASGTVAQAIGGQPLPGPPKEAQATAFGEEDLPSLREQVRRHALHEGLPSSRAQDLVAAVSEITANTVVHAGVRESCGSGGTTRPWCARSRTRDRSPTRSPGATPTRLTPRAAMACASPTSCVTWSSCDPGPGAPSSGYTCSSADAPARAAARLFRTARGRATRHAGWCRA